MPPRKKKIKPMFWITGNYYECKKMWASIVGSLDDPNIEVVDCGYNATNTPSHDRLAVGSDVIHLLRSRDMFDDRPRIIRMKGLPEDYTIIADYLRFVRDDNVLVVDGPIGYRKTHGKGSRWIPAAASKFYKTIAKEGKVFKFAKEAKDDGEAQSWCRTVVDELGKKIDGEALLYLIRAKGRDLDTLYCDLCKLAQYQSGKEITLDDVKVCSVPLFTRSSFELVDDLCNQKLDQSLIHLISFCENAGVAVGSSFRGEVERLIGLLYKTFLFLVLLKDSGSVISYQSAQQATAGLKKRSSKQPDGTYHWNEDLFAAGFIGANIRKTCLKKFLNLPKQRVYGAFLHVCYAKHQARLGYTKEAVKMCLDALCMSICGKISSHGVLCMMGFDEDAIRRKA